MIFFPYTAAFATCVKLLLMGLPLRAPHATREVFNRPEVAGTSAVEYLQKIAVHRSIMFGYVWKSFPVHVKFNAPFDHPKSRSIFLGKSNGFIGINE